jgi:hypothetical protein
MKQTENIRRHLGETLTIRWGTSKGRDTYGYTTCSLRNQRGKRVAACNGGGYDMRGTVIGNWLAATFPNELRALKPEDMPKNSHWQPDRTRVCNGQCKVEHDKLMMAAIEADEIEKALLPRLPEDAWTCPKCGGPTRSSGDGKRIDDGNYFYGLHFYDPNYDPGKAVVGQDVSNRTIGGENGKTVEQLEADGKSFGLERLQAFYKQTAPHSTERHIQPTIDGACGESSVMNILNAIGLTLRKVHSSSKLDVYSIEANPTQDQKGE